MPLFHSKHVRGSERVPAPQWAGDVVAARFEMAIPTGVDDDDQLELGILPAHARILDVVLDIDDVDSHGTPTFSIDVGLMSGEVGSTGSRTVGNQLFAGNTTGRTGGVARPATVGAFRIAPSAVDRSIGVKIVAKAATAAAGVVGLTVFYST